MVAKKPKSGKKYYSAEAANATLPLVRAIVRDIADLARELDERHERVERLQAEKGGLAASYREEVEQIVADIDRGHSRMGEYIEELTKLGIELKDVRVGLIDFPCWVGNREVYLCWRLDEPEVGHWHELDAGFAGRQKLNNLGARPQVASDKRS